MEAAPRQPSRAAATGAGRVVRTVELFAGIGGFRLAADRLGLATRWANDHCPRACAVYRARFGEGELRPGDLREHLDEVPPHDLLTAGFPCQPFSSAGKKHGVRDPRGTLFEMIVRVLGDHRPEWFVLENVKRLLSMERGDHFATILAALARLEYRIEWRLLNAADFGLPQNRQRVFLVGTRLDLLDDGTERWALARDGEVEGSGTRVRRAEWRAIRAHGARFPTWGIAESEAFFARDLSS